MLYRPKLCFEIFIDYIANSSTVTVAITKLIDPAHNYRNPNAPVVTKKYGGQFYALHSLKHECKEFLTPC